MTLLNRRGYEFTIQSTHELDEEQQFLALENYGRPGEFILYRLNCESGDYEYTAAPDGEANLIEAAVEWMVLEGYERGRLSAKEQAAPQTDSCAPRAKPQTPDCPVCGAAPLRLHAPGCVEADER